MSKLPKGWIETTLGEVCDITSAKRIYAKEYQTSGIPFFRGKEVTEKFNGNNVSTELFITKEKYYEIKSKYGVPSENDILLTSVGTLGNPYLVEKDFKFYFKDGNLTWFRDFRNIDSTFLFYWIVSSEGKEALSHAKIGSTQQAYTMVALKKVSISLPQNIDEQKAIASILISFDNKIKLLQEQNKTLEAIAQTVFKEWFGKYQIGDDLPEGWRSYNLCELVDTVNGYSYKGKELVEESDEALVTLKSFDRNGGFQTRGFKPFKGNPKSIQEVKIGDLVVAHTDLTQDAEVLGNPAFIFDNGGFDKMYITMDLVKVNSINSNVSSSFLYYLMKDRAFKGHCVGYSNGTTVLHLSKKAIPEYQVFLPTDFATIQEFSAIADATTNKISLNIEEIKSLKQTRDTLLPKLMSGKLRVEI